MLALGSRLMTFVDLEVSGVRNVRKQLNYMHQILRPMKEVLVKAMSDMHEQEDSSRSAKYTAKYMVKIKMPIQMLK